MISCNLAAGAPEPWSGDIRDTRDGEIQALEAGETGSRVEIWMVDPYMAMVGRSGQERSITVVTR